jgi:hypothetical protein
VLKSAKASKGAVERRALDEQLTHLLDSTLVAIHPAALPDAPAEKPKDLVTFSQERHDSTLESFNTAHNAQAELVDYAIWLLFHHRAGRSASYAAAHLLCQGYERSSNADHRPVEEQTAATTIPGLTCHSPNHPVNVLKSPLWGEALRLMGKKGDKVMLDMLLNCSLFSSLQGGQRNYYQLSGGWK